MSHHRRRPNNINEEILQKEDKILHELEELRHDQKPRFPTSIHFTEITMNPTEAGQSQVFTGVFAPAGSVPPTDAAFTIASNDPAVSPTVDPTGLIVSVTYPAGWVESTALPLAFAYSASSASVPSWTLSATITPSASPVVTNFPTSVAFTQTT